MRVNPRNPYWLFLLRLALGGVFIVASLDKISHPAAFALAIRNYQILPIAVSNLFAITLPWIELAAGALLILGVKCRSNAAILSGLMFVFNIALVLALVRGLNINCGCFDVDAKEAINGWYILRDLSLLAVGVLLFVFERQDRFPLIGRAPAEELS